MTAIGQVLLANSENQVYHSNWFPAGGNEATFVLDYIAQIGSGEVKVQVETKNSEDDDNLATAVGAVFDTGAAGATGRHPFTRGASLDRGSSNQGFKELVRFTYDVYTGTGVHIRMLNPSWLSH